MSRVTSLDKDLDEVTRRTFLLVIFETVELIHSRAIIGRVPSERNLQ